MPNRSNFSGRKESRRRSALIRRKADMEKYSKLTDNVSKAKLEIVKTEIANLKNKGVV